MSGADDAHFAQSDETDDRILLSRYADTRDAEAFQILVSRYQNLVWSACRRILGNSSNAEDAVQNVFLALAKSSGSIESNVAAWLHSTAVNCSTSIVRSTAARRNREQLHSASVVTIADEHAWKETRDVIDVCLAELDEEDRQLVVEHFYRGRTQLEIGKRLGVGQQAVAVRLKKIIEQLRRALRRRGLPVTAAAITGGLKAGLAEASAPAHLAATLAKVGISGIGYSSRFAFKGLSTTTKGALIAVPIALCIFAVWFFWGRDNPGLSGVLAQLDTARSIQYTMARINSSVKAQTEEIDPKDVSEKEIQHVHVLDGYLERIEDLDPDGTIARVMIANYRTKKFLRLDMHAKTYVSGVRLKRQLPDAPNPAGLRKLAPQTDLAAWLATFYTNPAESTSVQNADGQKLLAYRNESHQRSSMWRYSLWADPASMLPVRTLGTFRNPSPGVGASDWVRDSFVFDAPLAESLFSTDPPAGFTKTAIGKPQSIPIP